MLFFFLFDCCFFFFSFKKIKEIEDYEKVQTITQPEIRKIEIINYLTHRLAQKMSLLLLKNREKVHVKWKSKVKLKEEEEEEGNDDDDTDDDDEQFCLFHFDQSDCLSNFFLTNCRIISSWSWIIEIELKLNFTSLLFFLVLFEFGLCFLF